MSAIFEFAKEMKKKNAQKRFHNNFNFGQIFSAFSFEVARKGNHFINNNEFIKKGKKKKENIVRVFINRANKIEITIEKEKPSL